MPKKVLYVGDPHAVVSELSDCDALLRCIVDAVKAHEPDRVVFLGDQVHHHGIAHLEVMAWWEHAFRTILAYRPVDVLVGNHDKCGNGREDISWMQFFRHTPGDFWVIDQPWHLLLSGVTTIPHMDSKAAFLASVDEQQSKTIVCHQAFRGGSFENGFNIGDEGVDVSTYTGVTFISGHIHAPQEFDVGSAHVWYVGAPRWRTAADANVERHLWVVTHDDTGAIVDRVGVPTGAYCRRIWDFQDEEGVVVPPGQDLLDRSYDKKDDHRVTIKGSEEYLRTRRRIYDAAGWRVRTVETGAKKVVRVRESEGVPTAFRKFLGGFRPPHGTPVQDLEALAKERLVLQ